MIAFAVFIGAGMGGLARYSIALLGARLVLATGFPFATLVINILGCFLMGIAVSLLPRSTAPAWVFPLITTGFLGGFTTFSAFSLESMQLLQKNQTALACIYMAASVIVSLLAIFAGVALARFLGRA